MLGVCYYPEHWEQSVWSKDAKMMVDLGLTYVRIGEFAWSRIESKQGEITIDWLDQAIETLSDAGLKVVLCTPTATPPKWLVDKWPEILPVDSQTGRVRGFGSRRHYDFSSDRYLEESLRITSMLAKRYGMHDAVVGWQTDNELCAHGTALSGSSVALEAFRLWCQDHYGDIDSLNRLWGNVFWSMEYGDFTDIELPFGAVAEVNPAHSLAYRRFSSDQVVRFNDRMVKVIRDHSPKRFVTHNFIPFNETGVDNFAISNCLDFASYDSYPLGRTDIKFSESSSQSFRRYMRTGHPDLASYNHDQTRGLNDKDFWIMEQQPGPVNWAPRNTRPAPGMVRFWTLEAFAHGASCVSYFRWRQAPFAQEQMHAGLLRPDNSKTEAWQQIEQVYKEIEQLDLQSQKTRRASVAILTGAEQFWVTDIERQSDSYDCDNVQFSYYSALRKLGLSIDFISVDSDFSQYSLIVVPCLPILDESFVNKCESSNAIFVFGPRTGAKTREFSSPMTLPPGPLQRILPLKVLSIETVRADCFEKLVWKENEYKSQIWREEIGIESGADINVIAEYKECEGEGRTSPAIVRNAKTIYIGTLTCDAFLYDFFEELCREVKIETLNFGDDVRVRRKGGLMFAFNYSDKEVSLYLHKETRIILGSSSLKPRDVVVWVRND